MIETVDSDPETNLPGPRNSAEPPEPSESSQPSLLAHAFRNSTGLLGRPNQLASDNHSQLSPEYPYLSTHQEHPQPLSRRSAWLCCPQATCDPHHIDYSPPVYPNEHTLLPTPTALSSATGNPWLCPQSQIFVCICGAQSAVLEVESDTDMPEATNQGTDGSAEENGEGSDDDGEEGWSSFFRQLRLQFGDRARRH
ncbi:hypothetical protein EJ06DRAFT_419763 [Trichodelitschia bisporula]|uniref:Uncharacterized protein n=1 Tax=Trichodelitschia bisporula TaxID=703511 RepID=A0A6G1HVX1_9PEZI|nr:hypothetical protein EJ06DRAFT_419763 [Trichodelitschia bisporula]